MAISTKPVVVTNVGIQFIAELTDCSTGLCPFLGGGGGAGNCEIELLVTIFFTHSEMVNVDLTELITSDISAFSEMYFSVI